MTEYIDRQVAIDALKQLPHEYKTKEQRARTGGIAACQTAVQFIPAADVRPVVRCRDCFANGLCSVQDALFDNDLDKAEDFYCAYGRREEWESSDEESGG